MPGVSAMSNTSIGFVPSASWREALRRYEWLRWVLGLVAVLGIGLPLANAYHVLPFVINGVSDGSIYSLAAIGLVLTYKTTGVFNFAIGAQAAASAYVFYSLRTNDHLAWPLAAVITLVAVTVVGTLILERVAYWLSDAPPVMRIVATIGILVLLESGLNGLFGPAALSFPTFLPQASYRVAGFNVSGSQIIVSALALVATCGLSLFFRKVRLGVAMQGVVDDPNLLSLEGTSPAAVRRYAWAIGSAFISISGMLIAPELGINVDYMLLFFIAAFGAAAIGAFSSLPVTFAAAIGIGITMNVLSDRLAGQKNLVLAELYTQIPFLALILALLFLPRSKLIERGTRRVRRLPPVRSYSSRTMAGAGAVALIVAFLIPKIAGADKLNQYSTGLGFAVILASLALLIWTSGQISLCQVAFAAVAATTFAHAESAGVPWFAAVLLGGLITVPIGMLVAIPSFRLSGIYLAVATFGFGLLFQNLVYPTFVMFGVSDTVHAPRPVLTGHLPESDVAYYYTALALALVCACLVIVVGRSRLGRMLRGLADSPAAVEAHGTDTRLTRVFVFCIAGFLAGIGGIVIAGATQSAGGTATGPFGYFNSLVLVAILAFCGRRSLLSPVIAAFVFEVLKVYAPFSSSGFQNYEGVGFGVLAIAAALLPGIGQVRLRDRSAERELRTRIVARSELLRGRVVT
jgi:branched-subunit amino acid ABC-type transport system permease component